MNGYVKYISLCLVCTFACFNVTADVVDDATLLVENRNYAEARELLYNFIDTQPANKQQANAYQLLGECELAENNFREAKRLFLLAKEKGSVNANLFLGRLAFMDYDFTDARKYYNTFNASKNKSPRVSELYPEFSAQLNVAENALDRVEQIVVIDTLHVDKQQFFKAYHIPKSMGAVRDASQAPFDLSRREARTVYVNESNDQKMWAQNDTTGFRNIAESILLTDGTWRAPEFLPEEMTMNGNVDFPFMLPDGTTLYFASDGDESMGGYDIFVASRDAASGEWLKPQNIGMPYNSPADDYLLVTDEENGFGWWASDRELNPDYVTIYIYLLNDMRRNIDPDNEDILDFAQLNQPELTLPEENYEIDIDDAKKRLHTLLNTEIDYRVPEFNLPMPKGNAYHFFTDFKSAAAARLMKDYLSMCNDISNEESVLDADRRKYAQRPNQSLAQQISRREQSLTQQRLNAAKKLSDVYKAELY